MAVITKISKTKESGERYHIYLDGGFAFTVDEDVLIKFHLRKGLELDDFLLTEIFYENDIQSAYKEAVKFLSKKMRTEAEVRNFLKEKEADESIIQEVLYKLYEHKFLNDEEYAHAYVRTQKNTTDKGSGVIFKELLEKGIKQEMAVKAIEEEYPYEEQLVKAITVSQKYMKRNKKDSKRIARQKAEQLLLRKGYPSNVISLVWEEMEDHDDERKETEAIRYQWEKAHRKYAKLTGYEYEQKVKQFLYRKGFSLELIEQIMKEHQENQYN